MINTVNRKNRKTGFRPKIESVFGSRKKYIHQTVTTAPIRARVSEKIPRKIVTQENSNIIPHPSLCIGIYFLSIMLHTQYQLQQEEKNICCLLRVEKTTGGHYNIWENKK